ncbi:MAG: aminomethyl-transferring glycine dehydrogenase subunit GcvPA [Candidatus Hadarchaeota archaeon]
MSNRYIPLTEKEKRDMLDSLGADSIDDLYSDIPPKLKLNELLDIPPSKSEREIKEEIKKILLKNDDLEEFTSFLGGGVWNHYIPDHVKNLTSRSEFLTSYTPYQAEASQGLLQAMFEYQSMITELVDLPVVNSSMYGWPSALGEAALMSSRITRGSEFLVPEYISPKRFSVLETYCSGPEINIRKIKQGKTAGKINISDLEEKINDNTSGFYLEIPSYLGFIETQTKKISRILKEKDVPFVVGVNPISLGILEPPGEYGADIVVGEGQPLGNPINFGGPLLGIFACKDDREYIHQLPGRISGMTQTEKNEERGFVMTLQTREQHIRREKATSNICTNNMLCALASLIYLSSLGAEGLQRIAEKCAENAEYAMKRLNDLRGVNTPLFDAPHFNEFTIKFDQDYLNGRELRSKLLSKKIMGGVPLCDYFKNLKNASLWCTTEKHSKEDIENLVCAIKEIREEKA